MKRKHISIIFLVLFLLVNPTKSAKDKTKHNLVYLLSSSFAFIIVLLSKPTTNPHLKSNSIETNQKLPKTLKCRTPSLKTYSEKKREKNNFRLSKYENERLNGLELVIHKHLSHSSTTIASHKGKTFIYTKHPLHFLPMY